MSPRHKRTLEGRFVLRADSIRPYSWWVPNGF